MMFTNLLLMASSALAQEDIRPLKPALEVHEPILLWPWLVAALALLVAAYGAWRWWRRPAPTPEERFRAALAAASRAFDEGSVGDAVDACLDALRAFVHDTTDIPARYLTADELRPRLRDRLPEPVFADVDATLTALDSLRFAGAELDEVGLPGWIDAFVAALTAPEPPDASHPNAPQRAAS